ncbi:MAG TPA: hypothetical protein VF414_15910 [Thermoanaerobaculia bacterium]
MREMTKSMMSFSWAMSLFGLRQMTCMLMPQSWKSATSSFDAVTRSTEDQLGSTTDSLFRAGDNLQRGLVDLMFGMFTFGMAGRNGWGGGRRDRDDGGTARRPGQWAADAMRRSANAGDAGDVGADFVQRTAQAGADALRQSADAIDPRASYGGGENVGWGPMPGSR